MFLLLREKRFLFLAFFWSAAVVDLCSGMCWKPGANPFSAPPSAERLQDDNSLVKIDWSEAFEKGRDCSEVDFMIKSHPRLQPAQYKLSDFTLKGQRSAVIKIEQGPDFVFQVVAREDKGTDFGIEYKYSPMVTSYANGGSPQQKGQSGSSSISSSSSSTFSRERSQNYERITVAPTYAPLKPVEDFGATSPRPQQRYKIPELKSLETAEKMQRLVVKGRDINPDPFHNERVKAAAESKKSSKPDFDQCIPILRDLDGFGHGSKMRRDRIFMAFIQFMNQQPISLLDKFLSTRKSCHEHHEKGYLKQGKCCPSPWSDAKDCDSNFSECDGRCVPTEWIGDGWTDCADGSDEPELKGVNGKPMTRHLQSIQCSAVILSAAHMCTTSGRGLSAECMDEIMGEGGCNPFVGDYVKI